jgi:hypothetical protein
MENLKSKHIVKKWCETIGELSDDHRYFSTTIVKKLSDGSSFSVAELDEILHIPIRRIKKLISKRPHTNFSSEKNIIEHNGFTSEETKIKIHKENDSIFYASNAWQSLGMSVLLKKNLVISTTCQFSGEEINIEIPEYGYETDCDEIMVSFLSLNDLSLDKINNISNWSFFIKGVQQGEEWIQDHPDKLLMPLSLAYQSARDTTVKLYQLITNK